MDAVEELAKDVYAHFGLAAYWGQCFETTLCTLLLGAARVKGEVANAVEIDALELVLQKKVMGVLIRDIRSKVQLPTNTEPVFDAALDRRNFLNHHFFRERAWDFHSEAGMKRMIAELEEIQSAIKQADQIAELLCLALGKFLGITPEMLHAEFEQEKKTAQSG